MIIDIHSHIFEQDIYKKIPKKSTLKDMIDQVLNKSGEYSELLFNIEKRIDFMDKKNIDMQALSVVPFTFFYESNVQIGIKMSRLQNEGIANAVKLFEERFIGIATVPLQDIEKATEELEYAVKILDLKGVEIATHIGDKNLDDPSFYPFWRKAQDLDVPVVVHPINPSHLDRMGKYYLANIIGFPFETTLAISNIIFGGILDKFPRLKFCFVHAGGFLPYQIGRLDHGFNVRHECKEHIKKHPSRYMEKMYFDTITHDVRALNYLLSLVGSAKVLAGSDFPYDMGDMDFVQRVKELSGHSSEEIECILGKNAMKFFKNI